MSRNTVLAGIAAIFAAMLGRMGWVDWLGVLDIAGWVAGAFLFAGVLAAVLIGLPAFLLWAVVHAVAGLAGLGRPKPGALSRLQ